MRRLKAEIDADVHLRGMMVVVKFREAGDRSHRGPVRLVEVARFSKRPVSETSREPWAVSVMGEALRAIEAALRGHVGEIERGDTVRIAMTIKIGPDGAARVIGYHSGTEHWEWPW